MWFSSNALYKCSFISGFVFRFIITRIWSYKNCRLINTILWRHFTRGCIIRASVNNMYNPSRQNSPKRSHIGMQDAIYSHDIWKYGEHVCMRVSVYLYAKRCIELPVQQTFDKKGLKQSVAEKSFSYMNLISIVK